MQEYLQRNELLNIYQPGFRANHSTDTCLSQLTKMVLNGSETGKHTENCFDRNFISQDEVHWFFKLNGFTLILQIEFSSFH